MTRYLSARDVGKRYGDTAALNGASLDLYQGEIFALPPMGPEKQH